MPYLLLALALALGVVAISIMRAARFISNRMRLIEDGREIGPARTIADRMVCAFLLDAGAGAHVLIDAGMDTQAKAILAELGRRGLGPEAIKAIFLTHAHTDHFGGCALFPQADVYALEAEVDLAEGRRKQGGLLGPLAGLQRRTIHITHALAAGEEVVVGDLRIRALPMPGHTLGSAAYVCNGVVFMGDSADARIDGRIQEPPALLSEDSGAARTSLATLADRIRELDSPIEWLAFAHSGVLRAEALFRPPGGAASHAPSKI